MFKLEVDESITLRILEPSDARELFKVMDESRSSLRRWLPWVDSNETWKDTRTFIEISLRQLERDESMQMGIWFQNKIVGVIGLYHIDRDNRSVSIGYWLGEPYRGQGIMTRACRALVKAAFLEQGFNRVEIRCASGNVDSKEIPKRLGFVFEGRMRQAQRLYHQFVDLEIYSALANEWLEVVK
jgi:ribosomal-protein-serine acetyltransferase